MKTIFALALVASAGVAAAQPATFIDLGVIGGEGSYTFDTYGSLNSTGSGTDTELGLWDAAGTLLDANDDATGLQSEITAVLSAGEYYIATSEYDSVFGDGFTNTGSGFEVGEMATVELNINGVNFASTAQGDFNQTQFYKVTVTPAPASAALLGLGGLVVTRRRRR